MLKTIIIDKWIKIVSLNCVSQLLHLNSGSRTGKPQLARVCFSTEHSDHGQEVLGRSNLFKVLFISRPDS